MKIPKPTFAFTFGKIHFELPKDIDSGRAKVVEVKKNADLSQTVKLEVSPGFTVKLRGLAPKETV